MGKQNSSHSWVTCHDLTSKSVNFHGGSVWEKGNIVSMVDMKETDISDYLIVIIQGFETISLKVLSIFT